MNKINIIHKSSLQECYIAAARTGISEMMELVGKKCNINDIALADNLVEEFEENLLSRQPKPKRRREASMLDADFMLTALFNMKAETTLGRDSTNLCIIDKDLNYPKINGWIFGIACGHVTIQSIYRMANAGLFSKKLGGISDNHKSEIFKTLLMHELGHLLLPMPPVKSYDKRPEFRDHCRYRVCLMSQFMSLCELEKLTRIRLGRSSPLCEFCMSSISR